MGVAVAPLTDAVLGSVPSEFEGAASGINNATARIGGLLAVALAGFVLAPGQTDVDALSVRYQWAMFAAAFASLFAALVGGLTVSTSSPRPSA